MNRFEKTMAERVGALLGDSWTVEVPGRGWGALIATHENGSRVMVTLYGADGRRNATADDATECVERLTRKLRGEVPKYTAEWADRARAALAELGA